MPTWLGGGTVAVKPVIYPAAELARAPRTQRAVNARMFERRIYGGISSKLFVGKHSIASVHFMR